MAENGEIIKPHAVFTPFGGAVEVQLFGPPKNWAIKDKDQDTLGRVGTVARAAGVRELFAPVPTEYNAAMCNVADLQEEVFCGPDRQVVIRRGVKADGCRILYGSAFWLSSADCLTIVVRDPIERSIFAAHAGRDSLLDRKLLGEGTPGREHFSVVDSIVDRVRELQSDPRLLRVFLTCSIGPRDFYHRWDDPKWGKFNELMTMMVVERYGPQCVLGDLKNGCISLAEIARAQFMKHGVARDHIGFDGIDTSEDAGPHTIALMSDDGPDRPYDGCAARWWSCRRGDKARNGVLVIHRW